MQTQIKRTEERIPRPQGLTYLSLNYQRGKSEESKEQIYKHVVLQYTIQGFRLNKVPLSLTQLSQYLKLPLNKIMDYVTTLSTNMGSLSDPSQTKELMRSLITLSTSWAIQDKGLIMQQVELLINAQGGKYKPFISAELNKALKLNLESNKNIMEAYKAFFTSTQNTTNILNLIQPKQENNKNTLSPDEALKLMRESEQQALTNNNNNTKAISSTSSTNLDNEQLAEELFKEHGLVDFSGLKFGASMTEPESQKANNNAASKLTRPTAKKPSQHTDFEARRGHDYLDTDALPNRE